MSGLLGGLIGGGASLLGGLFGSDANEEAAKAAAELMRQAAEFQKGVYTTAQGNLSPYIAAGQGGVLNLAGLLGAGGDPTAAAKAFETFTGLPSYQFPLQHGNLATMRNLASHGLTGSGAATKGLAQFNQGYASQQLGGYLDQLAKLAGLGQTSSVSLGNIGTGVGSNLNSALSGQAGATAGGILGSANSLNTGIGNALGFLGGSNSSFGNSGSVLGSLGGWLKGFF